MRRARFATAGLALAAFAQAAMAEDSNAGVPFAPLTAQPAGGVTATGATAALHGHQVTLTMPVTVRTRGAAIGFRLPAFGWLGEDETYADRQFPELAASIDGAPTTIADTVTAQVGARDVTAAVRAAHLDPYAIADTPPFVTVEGATLARLTALGAVARNDDGVLAKWSVRRAGSIAFTSAGRHMLTLRYTARPGFALLDAKALGALAARADYCLTPKAAAAALAGRGDASVAQRFEIPVGIAAAHPATRLTADAAADAAGKPSLIVFCGADGRGVIAHGRVESAPARVGASGMVSVLVIGAQPDAGASH